MRTARIADVWGAFLLAAALCPAASAGATTRPVYAEDFASGLTWRPVGACRVEIASDAGQRCLHVTGRQEGGWNYAQSGRFALTGGGKYRLTARLRVAKIDPAIAPYLKVEFQSRAAGGGLDARKDLGRASSSSYDLARGGWQELTGGFAAPPSAGGGWLAIEKGTHHPVTIEAWLDDVRVVPIEEFSERKALRFHPVPAPLAARKAVHPRLHMTPRRLADLKARISAKPYPSLLAEVRQVADAGVRRGPPAYRLRDAYSGDEQLWQRSVGNMIPHLAICHLLTGERKYLDSAQAWMLASAGYETWGLGRIDGLDLAAGHQLYGMALGYDWLHDELEPQARETIRQCLLRRGAFLFEKLSSRQAWWHKAYLQNHQWVNMTGLAAAGLALYGESGGTNVDGWITLPLRMFKRTLESLGPDGASHEGLPYWTYGLEYLLKFADLAGDLLGEDLVGHSEWFRNTASFCQYFTLPRGSWQRRSCLMTFADGPRLFWYGPDYMLRRLAGIFRDGHAQWLADELDAADVCSAEARFLNLLWVDPSVEPVGPAGLETFRHFADMGLVVMRGGWDGDEAMLAFKCGPHIGHRAVGMYSYDPGGGHVHPDAGSIQLFAFGEWLIVDDGYTFKTTAWQNTALIGGVGQIGEGGSWFAGSSLCAASRGASILLARPGRSCDYAVGDVTPAYQDRAGLEAFRRHVLYVKPACWLVIDELKARKPTTFELRFHADFPFRPNGDGSFAVGGKKGKLRITSLGAAPAAMRTEKQKLKSTGGSSAGELDCLVLSNDAAAATTALFVTVLQAAPADKPLDPAPKWLAPPEGAGEGGRVVIRQGGRERTFRLLPDRKDPAKPIVSDLP